MDLNYNTMNLPVQSKNLRSISENPDFVREKIFKEIDLGRVAGPFDYPPMPVVGKKCNPNRKLTEMSRTGNLLLLISSLILRCFAKTFSFIVYFYILETHRL